LQFYVGIVAPNSRLGVARILRNLYSFRLHPRPPRIVVPPAPEVNRRRYRCKRCDSRSLDWIPYHNILGCWESVMFWQFWQKIPETPMASSPGPGHASGDIPPIAAQISALKGLFQNTERKGGHLLKPRTRKNGKGPDSQEKLSGPLGSFSHCPRNGQSVPSYGGPSLPKRLLRRRPVSKGQCSPTEVWDFSKPLCQPMKGEAGEPSVWVWGSVQWLCRSASASGTLYSSRLRVSTRERH
jgi:hypothetical protein